MRVEKIIHMCKIVRKMNILIGVAVTIFPIIFWKQIPDKIPVHYGISGKVDRFGGKEELILLFFVLWLSIGIFSIVAYYLKTSGVSKYASELEVESLYTIYPIFTWTSLIVICILSYIIVSSILERNLGKFFLPITLIAICIPIVIYRRKERRYTKSNLKEKKKFCQEERNEKGVSYRTAVDWWLALLFVSCIGLEGWGVLQELFVVKRIDWGMLGVNVFLLLVILHVIRIQYIFYSEHLLIKVGWIGRERIPYSNITNIKETQNPLSAPACSLNRIEIDYTIGKRNKFTLISPVHLKEFKSELIRRCEK